MMEEEYKKVDIATLSDKHAEMIENIKSQNKESEEILKDKKVYISYNTEKKKFTVDITDLESINIPFNDYINGVISSFMAIGLDVYIKEEK